MSLPRSSRHSVGHSRCPAAHLALSVSNGDKRLQFPARAPSRKLHLFVQVLESVLPGEGAIEGRKVPIVSKGDAQVADEARERLVTSIATNDLPGLKDLTSIHAVPAEALDLHVYEGDSGKLLGDPHERIAELQHVPLLVIFDARLGIGSAKGDPVKRVVDG